MKIKHNIPMILNIEDIKRRQLMNPEPQEVVDMRNYILDTFKNLEFIEDGHKYFLHNPDGSIISVPSVSSLIDDFVPKSDWDKIKSASAKKEGCTVEELTRRWEETNIKSTNNGTSVHLYGENLMKMMLCSEDFDPVIKPQYEKGYLIPYGPKQDAVQQYWQDLYKIPDIYPLLPEVKMYMPVNNKFGIKKLYCGTADILLAYKNNQGEWGILLQDFKTNKELIKQYSRSNNKMMLEPFKDLYEEPLGHYTIQLSLYSLMLMNLGFKIFDRRLIWLKDDGTYDKIAVPDITEKLIQFYS